MSEQLKLPNMPVVEPQSLPEPEGIRYEHPAELEVGKLRVELAEEIDKRKSAEKEARTDELTELANRKGFNEGVATLLATTTEEEQKNIKILSFDLDEFKGVNDNYGHPIGDETLKAVAAVLEHIIIPRKDGEVVARLGGDEFAAGVKGTDEEIKGYVNRIRTGVTVLAGILNIENFGISIGVAGFREPGFENETVDEFKQRVDNNLYTDKALKGTER